MTNNAKLDFIERTPGVATATTHEGKDDVVYVRLVVDSAPKPSASGKTMVLASSRGAVAVPVGGDVAKLSLNLYR